LLEESLGLSHDAVSPDVVPREFTELVGDAMRGAENEAAAEPVLEQRALRFLDEFQSTLLDRDGFTLRKERWPGAAPYAVCLTHDVDNIERPLRHLIQVRKRFSRSDFVLSMLRLRSMYNNTSYIEAIENERKLRSSFYFLSSNYDLRKISGTLDELNRRGWDVGLHGDFGTHDSEEKMGTAVARFTAATGLKPRGLREHYLKFDYGTTWDIVEKSGFEYDSTVGYADKLGFRLGLCTPFHPPSRDWTPMRILEIPLVLMDTTLWGYLKRSEDEGLTDVLTMKSKVAKVEGLFTLLWHSEAMRMKGGRLYPRVLDELVKDGCFAASGDSIASWWNARARPMLADKNEYRMEGSPSGLCLRFKAKGERDLTIEGGSIETTNATEALIRVKSDQFRLRVK
jgi:peptidoglycan/xylan/chitin deacetylase (PgdA/CDA1 family)